MIDKLKLIIIFCIIVMFSPAYSCKASETSQFNLYCSNSNVEAGKNCLVEVFTKFPEFQNISAFRVKITFDTSNLEFENIYNKQGVTLANEFKSSVKGNTLTIIYVTSNEGINLTPNSDTEIFSLKFKAKANSVGSHSTITATFDGVSDYDINEIYAENPLPLNINIVDKIMSDCSLKDLVPSEGDLSPEFNPQIYNYDLTVPYSTKFIEFDALPNNPNAYAKVSRKNLNSAGSKTLIKITVTDSVTKDKSIYFVNVNRSSKPSSANDSNSSSENVNSQNSSGSTKNNSSSKGSSSYYSSDNYFNKDTDNDLSNSSLSQDDGSVDNNIENENVDSSETVPVNQDVSNSSDNPTNTSKTIVVKENKFNVFLAGFCMCCLMLIGGYFIHTVVKNYYSKKKNNVANNT